MKRLEPVLRRNLLKMARAYCRARGIAPSTASRMAHGSGTFFKDISAGKVTFTCRKYDEIMCWFERNWPNDKFPGDNRNL
jgi:hypothetical protein